MSVPEYSTGPVFRQALTRVFPRSPTSHWLGVAAMLADVAFETDYSGRFTAFGESSVLGIPVATLIGKDISELCRLTGDSESTGNNFGPIFAKLSQRNVVWRGVVALTRADGEQGNYQIFLASKPDEGRSRKERLDGVGAYGLLIDLDAPALQTLAQSTGRAAGMLDAQTGLWSATAFAEETSRRFDRLDVEGLPGTLILLGFARTPKIGHRAVAELLAQELRDVSRPTDILGRINATTFGLWCDGMDNLTGAERAARFCQRLPAALPGNPCISVGLVARWPGDMEDPQALLKQAGKALQQADKVAQAAADAGSAEPVIKGTWRVWSARRADSN